jgi:hypothetical protein
MEAGSPVDHDGETESGKLSLAEIGQEAADDGRLGPVLQHRAGRSRQRAADPKQESGLAVSIKK